MIEILTTAVLLYSGYTIYRQSKIIKAQANLLILLQTSMYIMEQVWDAEEKEKERT